MQTSKHPLRGQVAILAASAAFLAPTVLPAPSAFADPGNGQGKGHAYGHQKGDKPNKGKGHGKDSNPGKGNKGDKPGKGPKGNNGHGQGNAGQGQGSGNGTKGNGGDPTNSPPGNNGTIKIAGPGDEAGHPSNNPHPGCTFIVEWYGFDQGDDVVSTVTFTPQAPTSDVAISGVAPSSVFVGEDAAGGGTDLDGRQAYTLSFDGEPHPKQGYHAKLNVETPRSNGADGKSKVFWVEPCEAAPGEETPTEGEEVPGGTEVPGDTPVDEGVESDGTTPEGGIVDGETPDGAVSDGDAGAGAETDAVASGEAEGGATMGSDDDAAVPTAVDAGANPVIAAVTSPAGLGVIALLAIAGGAAVLMARRRVHG